EKLHPTSGWKSGGRTVPCTGRIETMRWLPGKAVFPITRGVTFDALRFLFRSHVRAADPRADLRALGSVEGAEDLREVFEGPGGQRPHRTRDRERHHGPQRSDRRLDRGGGRHAERSLRSALEDGAALDRQLP